MKRHGWRLTTILREAILNVFAGRGAAALVLVAVVAGIGTTLYLNAEWHTVRQELSAQYNRGAKSVDFAGAGAQGVATIARSSCDGLSSQPNVAAAGVSEDAGRTEFLQLGSGVRVVRASPALVPELNGHQAVIGSSLVAVSPGTKLRLSSRDYGVLDAVVGSGNEDALGIQSAVLIAAAAGHSTAHSCTVLFDVNTDLSLAVPVAQSQLISSGNPLLSNPRLSHPFDLAGAFLGRMDRLLPLLIGAIGGIFAAFLYRLRGGELAAYLFSGTTRKDLALLLWLEQVLVSGLATTAGVAGCCALGWTSSALTPTVAWSLLLGLSWLVAFTSVGLPLAVRRPHRLAKEQ